MLFESGHSLSNKIYAHPAKSKINLLSASRRFSSSATYRVSCEHADQTVRMRRLI